MSARDEAERLVAAALATASVAAGGFGAGDDPEADGAGGRFATGSPECCVCPVCRAIAAVRDPNPEFAERLASSAGDLAAAVTNVLRSFGAPGGSPGAGGAPSGSATPARDKEPDHEPDDEPWRAATRAALSPRTALRAATLPAPGTSAAPPPRAAPGTFAAQPPRTPMAKKAVKKAVKKATLTPEEGE